MSKTPYPGLDYSGPGSTVNRDADSGIRYGVISCNSMGEGFYDHQEMDYGEPHCPDCGCEVKSGEGADYECSSCGQGWDSEDCFPDEACGWSIEDGEYTIVNCLDNDAMVIKSPYYTYAQMCSPCVPGAGNLDNPMPVFEGAEPSLKAFAILWRRQAEEAGYPKVFALNYDWFDQYNPCPYPVIFRVEDDEPVFNTSKE